MVISYHDFGLPLSTKEQSHRLQYIVIYTLFALSNTPAFHAGEIPDLRHGVVSIDSRMHIFPARRQILAENVRHA